VRWIELDLYRFLVDSLTENQACVGKFAADIDFCCRDPSAPYSLVIPVVIRGSIRSTAPTISAHTYPSVIQSASSSYHEEKPWITLRRASRARLSMTGNSPLWPVSVSIPKDSENNEHPFISSQMIVIDMLFRWGQCQFEGTVFLT
jgi:hypothetical protein